MKASDLIHSMAILIANHGDLDVYCDCDGILEPASEVQAFNGLREGDESVFIVYSEPRMSNAEPSSLHAGQG